MIVSTRKGKQTGLLYVCIIYPIYHHKAKLLCLQCHITQNLINSLPIYINYRVSKYKVVKNVKDITERIK